MRDPILREPASTVCFVISTVLGRTLILSAPEHWLRAYAETLDHEYEVTTCIDPLSPSHILRFKIVVTVSESYSSLDQRLVAKNLS